jgi:ribose 5-phosphate isomerase A
MDEVAGSGSARLALSGKAGGTGQASPLLTEGNMNGTLLDDPARAAMVEWAASRLEPGITLGFGSGRAVWALIEVLGTRWAGQPTQVVVASSATEARATEAGLEVVSLDGDIDLDVVVDGADQVDLALNLIKGHGAALLREKLVVAAGRWFLVLAERTKLVKRLGEGMLLPVEVVPFAWPKTQRRLLGLVPEATLRLGPDHKPLVTDEGHHILDCAIPVGSDLTELSAAIKATLGVVEHGLFLEMADEVVLGLPDGHVQTLSSRRGSRPRQSELQQDLPPHPRGNPPKLTTPQAF